MTEEDAMKLVRRQFLQLAGAAGAASAVPRLAFALDYPTRPVRLVVGFPPGGSTDFIARQLGQSLSARLGQPFVIDNRPGAGSNIATESVVRAPPDGQVLLLAFSANAINAALYPKLNFNFITDIAPVAAIGHVPNLLLVNPVVPAKTVPEFINYVKAHPGQVNFGSGGNGTPAHVAGELLNMLAGINLVHVPYRGAGPAMIDMLGGRVQVLFTTVPPSIASVRAGKLRALAVTTATRSDALPDIPALAEFVPRYEASSWYGLVAPRNTPATIVEKLNEAVNAVLADPKMKAQLAELGGDTLALSPADFGKFIAEETEKWAKVVKSAGIKPV
jgi:tripartite-type tricarboxylate transporter receptor subunit TctC